MSFPTRDVPIVIVDDMLFQRSALPSLGSLVGITEEEVMANSLLFFIAGYKTTATLLQFAMYCLALNPDVQDRLRSEIDGICGGRMATYEELKDMEYLDWVISETMRKYPPVTWSDRQCCESTEVLGIKIPKGCALQYLISEIHHNPEYWPEPEIFKPERFDPQNKPENFTFIYLPFGVGPRSCLGMRLALLESKAALARVMQTFTLSATSNTEREPLDFKQASAFLVAKKPLFIKLTKRE